MLEQYRIADFIEWNRDKKLQLNPDFQRGSVWVPTARVFLIDTILRGLPVPKIFLRTKIDPLMQTSIREVVDGQQRLRAILDFAGDKFRLTSRASEFANLTYSELPNQQKRDFLEYPLAVDQLVNASENEVLEVFSRLNSYNVTLNPAEQRHAQYQGKFKWVVRDMSKKWEHIWSTYNILSTRERVRMEDDVTIAQLLMIATEGIKDGGADKIGKFYRANDSEFPSGEDSCQKVNQALSFFDNHLGEIIKETRLASPPQFLMLIAALMHRQCGIDLTSLKGHTVTAKMGVGPIDMVHSNLLTLASALESETPPDPFVPFVAASKSSTQRIASRTPRFIAFHLALGGDPI